jgi:hypothetical protein
LGRQAKDRLGLSYARRVFDWPLNQAKSTTKAHETCGVGRVEDHLTLTGFPKVSDDVYEYRLDFRRGGIRFRSLASALRDR